MIQEMRNYQRSYFDPLKGQLKVTFPMWRNNLKLGISIENGIGNLCDPPHDRVVSRAGTTPLLRDVYAGIRRDAAVLPPLLDCLKRQKAYTRECEKRRGTVIPWVFHRDGIQMRNFPYAAWRGACERADLAGMIGHDFRRTAVRNLERAGVPRAVAMKLVGHKTESVYRRYSITTERDLVDGVKKLATLHTETASAKRNVLPMKQAGKA